MLSGHQKYNRSVSPSPFLLIIVRIWFLHRRTRRKTKKNTILITSRCNLGILMLKLSRSIHYDTCQTGPKQPPSVVCRKFVKSPSLHWIHTNIKKPFGYHPNARRISRSYTFYKVSTGNGKETILVEDPRNGIIGSSKSNFIYVRSSYTIFHFGN